MTGYKLSKTDNNQATLYLTIVNGLNMLTGNPKKAITFSTVKAANNYKKSLTQTNYQDLQVSL